MMRVSQLKIINQIIPLYLLRNAQKFIRISIFKKIGQIGPSTKRAVRPDGLRNWPSSGSCSLRDANKAKQHLSVKQMRCLHCDLFK